MFLYMVSMWAYYVAIIPHTLYETDLLQADNAPAVRAGEGYLARSGTCIPVLGTWLRASQVVFQVRLGGLNSIISTACITIITAALT